MNKTSRATGLFTSLIAEEQGPPVDQSNPLTTNCRGCDYNADKQSVFQECIDFLKN